MKKIDHLLNFSKLDLLEQRKAKEAEIKGIFKIISNGNICETLLSGRGYWVGLYDRRIAEYKAFCIKNALKCQDFLKMTGSIS